MAWVRKIDTFTHPKGAQAAGVSTLDDQLGILDGSLSNERNARTIGLMRESELWVLAV